jgi:hypothetical protein
MKLQSSLLWIKNEKIWKSHSSTSLLDAYTPLNKGDEDRYGSLPNDYLKHFSEHYVDIRLPFTDAILQNAFNFDITYWSGAGLNWRIDKGDREKGGFLGHWWPVTWYINSITAPEFNNGLSGFPFSLEGGDNQLNELDQIYRPGKNAT